MARATPTISHIREERARRADGLGPHAAIALAATAVAVAGLGDSAYLTFAHYTSPAVLACADKGVINCAKVTTSSESMLFGVLPVAVLGLVWFAAMVALNLPRIWRMRGALGAWLARLRLAAAVVGIGFALYLVSAELLVIDAICLFCTIAHLLALALFVLVAAGSTQRGLGTT